ncbi:hypothetical protein RHGRI_013164 [Rhododendron griersonianum]|uniref:Uncharacterized protein n=1 Tax=Rhododendron griersonianum TaxID=479676 RepID=A0AAV6K4U1_9ERIC|nr:hypothetical protein RHGRI_013164 [Rhododendron griersonianum]
MWLWGQRRRQADSCCVKRLQRSCGNASIYLVFGQSTRYDILGEDSSHLQKDFDNYVWAHDYRYYAQCIRHCEKVKDCARTVQYRSDI